jgi:hypothetical protein
MSFKELIPLSAAIIFFLAATYPKPILVRVLREAHPHQVIARLCFVVFVSLRAVELVQDEKLI